MLVAGGSCGGACWRSVLEGCGRRWGGMYGGRSRLVDFWVMYGMVMDETLHVFPGPGVGDLLRVCQQEVFAVYHFGRCSADCF